MEQESGSLDAEHWSEVCGLEDLPIGAGVVALVDGQQVAVFQTAARTVHALSNQDPFSGSFVLGRGLLGDRDGQAYVASPLLKQRFDLETGACLDDPSVTVPAYAVSVVGGRVWLSRRPRQ